LDTGGYPPPVFFSRPKQSEKSHGHEKAHRSLSDGLFPVSPAGMSLFGVGLQEVDAITGEDLFSRYRSSISF
jgi:hypothetical protein